MQPRQLSKTWNWSRRLLLSESWVLSSDSLLEKRFSFWKSFLYKGPQAEFLCANKGLFRKHSCLLSLAALWCHQHLDVLVLVLCISTVAENLEHLHNNSPTRHVLVTFQLNLVKFTDPLTSVMPPKDSDYSLWLGKTLFFVLSHLGDATVY